MRSFINASAAMLATASMAFISLPADASPNKLGAFTNSSAGITSVTEGFISPGSHGAKIFSYTEGGASTEGGSHVEGGVGCNSCGGAGGNTGSGYHGGFGLNTGLELTEPGSAGVATQNVVFGESFSGFEW